MPSNEQQITNVIDTWSAATKVGDVETVLSLMTDDVVFLRPRHAPLIGRSAFAALAEIPPDQEPPQIDSTSEIQEIKVVGDWAYVWTKLSVVVTPPGGADPMKRSGHTLTIFTKQDGQWLLTRDANMLTAEADST